MPEIGNMIDNVKVVLGNAKAETALAAADYPASGSYIDVSGYEWVGCLVHTGSIDAGDTPGLTMKCADSATGTLDTISTTYLVHECAANDDGECVWFAFKTEALPTDHHFVSLVVADVTNGSYGDITFFLCEPRNMPVTQTTAVLPTASQHEFTGAE